MTMRPLILFMRMGEVILRCSTGWLAGVVHLLGEHDVVARKGAGIRKRILINYGYNFLKKNLVQSNKMFDIPHEKMLKVGMVYEL